MEEIKAYTRQDKLSDMIAHNSLLLMSISRFGLSLGDAGKTISQIEDSGSVDADTFLCVINLVSGKPFDAANVRLDTLTAYLKRAHTYFLDFILPSIRRKFLYAIDFAGAGDIPQLILRFFDEYVQEVRAHMDFEDAKLFSYIDDLLSGNEVDESFDIATFAKHHDAVDEKLKLLKDVLIRYCPAGNIDMLNSVLFDIMNCQADLESHCRVEDEILVPTVLRVEAGRERHHIAKAKEETHSEKATLLGKREIEILRHIAMGLSNKEIADKLCISVHTVTTHRRNICAKLEIHSPAGLTIYAILNGIIDPKEIGI